MSAERAADQFGGYVEVLTRGIDLLVGTTRSLGHRQPQDDNKAEGEQLPKGGRLPAADSLCLLPQSATQETSLVSVVNFAFPMSLRSKQSTVGMSAGEDWFSNVALPSNLQFG
jgi:hypothetical protein